MHERLSFYIKRDSVIHRLNPLTKLVLVLAFIGVTFTFPWYWTALFLFLFVLIPLSLISKVFREFLFTATRLILPAAGFLFVMQTLFQPIGEEIIFQFYFLDATRESLMFGF